MDVIKAKNRIKLGNKNVKNEKVGVIGAGSFGAAIANLLAYNCQVLVFCRSAEQKASINERRFNSGYPVADGVLATNELKEIAENCTLIFPIVPSENFRSMMHRLGPHLRPYHILIHGTKGLDIKGLSVEEIESSIVDKSQVSTMSEVITQESVVRRVGCLSGPNLANEIMEGQPTATVIGSAYQEVIDAGKAALKSPQFHVFGTRDIIGAELAGALKNIIAIGSGMLKGKGLGKNIQAMLITRGLTEMVHFSKTMGSSSSAFFGTAGIGDLVATATSKNSRNYTFGFRLGQGESMLEITQSMPELAEGVRTLKIVNHLARQNKIRIPIFQTLHKVVFENLPVEKALEYLMNYPYYVDVDFL